MVKYTRINMNSEDVMRNHCTQTLSPADITLTYPSLRPVLSREEIHGHKHTNEKPVNFQTHHTTGSKRRTYVHLSGV